MLSPNEILDSHQRWQRALEGGSSVAFEATIEALHKCSSAVLEIGKGLAHLGYPVADVILPCATNLGPLVEKIELATGQRIPAIVVEFWRIVGGVSLVDIDAYAHVAFWEDAGVQAEYCDGLRVEACDTAWANYIIEDYLDREEDGQFVEYPFMFDLSPDGYHKDNISGGSPYGVRPGGDWLPVWENFTWAKPPMSAPPGPLDFLGYLRSTVLECAGFPGFFGDKAFEPIRRRLLQDVQPF